MAKFIRVHEKYQTRYHEVDNIYYINLEKIAMIYFDEDRTKVRFIGTDDSWGFKIPLSEFMDLVNSAE